MQHHFSSFAHHVRFWNLFAGLVIGAASAAFFVSWIAPDKSEVLKLCRLDEKSIQEDQEKRHDWTVYSMNNITDQSAYIRQLIAHHELEISMSKKVLEFNPSKAVKDIANNIITTETKEVETLKAIAGQK